MTKKKPKELHKPNGRPTKYKEEFNNLAFKYTLLGLTDSQIAGLFEISESTLNKWKLDFPNFSESISNGKEKADAKVARALYKRCLGYEYTEEKEEIDAIGNTKHTTTTKEIPADVKAIKMWLQNRQPGLWLDKHNIDITSGGEKIRSISPIEFVGGEDE